MSSSIRTGGLSKNRIEALSDGIFAVAMTLMILDIRVPEISGMLVSTELLPKLFELWPKFLVYAMSFVISGIYWVGQHNQFHYIRHSDRILLWINIFFLMFVVMIPFSTALLGRYWQQQTALIIYGGNLIIIGLLVYTNWWYATDGSTISRRKYRRTCSKCCKEENFNCSYRLYTFNWYFFF